MKLFLNQENCFFLRTEKENVRKYSNIKAGYKVTTDYYQPPFYNDFLGLLWSGNFMDFL